LHTLGIDTFSLPVASRRKGEGRRLILFDFIIHRYSLILFLTPTSLPLTLLISDFEEYGLGDQGLAGIEAFLEEHQCNQICEAFGFDPMDKTKGNHPVDQGKDEPDNDSESSHSAFSESDSDTDASDSASPAPAKSRRRGKPLVPYAESEP
jgi:Alpha-kinase family